MIKMMISRIQRQLRDTKLVVHFLVAIFGISAWANLNGMWSELSLLVPSLPEGWDLPSYITIISQVANIGPLIFVIITLLCPGTKGKIELYASGGVILSSILSSFLLAFFWDKTSYVGGEEHSTGLLTLNFFMAFGDCVSSVAFYAFMSMMKPEYMASLLIGEGLSGMLPAMMALGQGVGDITCVNVSKTNSSFSNGTLHNTTTWHLEPHFSAPDFSVKVYFILIAVILACSFVAFVLLNKLPYCRSEFVDMSTFTDHDSIVSDKDHQSGKYVSSSFDNPALDVAVRDEITEIHQKTSTLSSSLNDTDVTVSGRFDLFGVKIEPSLLCFQAIVLLVNMTLTSFLSTIQDYSTLPYGLRPYHLATTLTQIANVMACILAQFYAAQSLLGISLITLLGQGGVAYVIYVASESPDPPLHGENAGGNLVLAVWIFMTLFLIYAKVCVAGVMRSRGRPYLIFTGVSTQIGSLIGAVTGFILVNEDKIFKSAPYC